MPSSAAERQKRYRERMKNENPNKYKEMQRKNAARRNLKRKRIADFEPEEQVELRRQWRENKKKKTYDEQKKEGLEYLTENNDKAMRNKQIRIETLNYRLKKENCALKGNINQMKKEMCNLKKKLSRSFKKKWSPLSNALPTGVDQPGPSSESMETELAPSPAVKEQKLSEHLLQSELSPPYLKEENIDEIEIEYPESQDDSDDPFHDLHVKEELVFIEYDDETEQDNFGPLKINEQSATTQTETQSAVQNIQVVQTHKSEDFSNIVQMNPVQIPNIVQMNPAVPNIVQMNPVDFPNILQMNLALPNNVQMNPGDFPNIVQMNSGVSNNQMKNLSETEQAVVNLQNTEIVQKNIILNKTAEPQIKVPIKAYEPQNETIKQTVQPQKVVPENTDQSKVKQSERALDIDKFNGLFKNVDYQDKPATRTVKTIKEKVGQNRKRAPEKKTDNPSESNAKPKSSQRAKTEEDFEVFGRYVAGELRKMPLHMANESQKYMFLYLKRQMENVCTICSTDC